MDLYEKIKELASAKNISISRLEEELGFANASLKRWRSSNPGADKLAKVADYFHVSVDYLLGREEQSAPNSLQSFLMPLIMLKVFLDNPWMTMIKKS